MKILDSLILTLSMFTGIPMPECAWTDENRRLSMVFLPFIGLIIGLVLWIFSAFASFFTLTPLMVGAGYLILPILITGGVHLDGFIDTVDALSSHADAEKKRQILKDPHVGAFAVIYAGVYFILAFAALTELPASGFSALILTLILVLGRTLGALSVMVLPLANEKGLAAVFASAADKKFSFVILISVCILTAFFLIGLVPIPGLAMVTAAASALFFIYRMAERCFGGISGDIAGFLISVSELMMLVAYVLFTRVIGL